MVEELFEERRLEYGQCKVFHHFDRLELLRNGDFLEVVPISVELDVTNRCPHRCFYCYQFVARDLGLDWGMHRSEDELDFDHAVQLLHTMGAAGVKAVEYCGRGEPFLYPHFVDLLKETRAAGLQAGVINSGSMLTEEQAQGVREARPLWIRFSIDSICEEAFNKIRRPLNAQAGCAVVKKNISRFCEIMGTDSSTRISASTVILPQNISELYPLACFTKECGMRAHVFRLVNLKGREKLYRRYWGEIQNALKRIRMDLEDSSYVVHLPPVDFYLPHTKPFRKCFFSLLDWAIDVNFNVYGCLENMYNRRFLLGNIGPKGKSFMDLVQSNRRLGIMDMARCCPACCRDEVNLMLNNFCSVVHTDFI
jgi:molybdenum cofactor biosynthesis enzyme MoaA